MHDYDSTNTLWGAPGAAAPHVDEMCLPFTPGQLSFGAGMNVKMTLTRFQQVSPCCVLHLRDHFACACLCVRLCMRICNPNLEPVCACSMFVCNVDGMHLCASCASY